MIDVEGGRPLDGQLERQAGEELAIARGQAAARGGPLAEPTELDAEERRLEIVEPARLPQLHVLVFPRRAVIAEAPHPLRHVLTSSQEHAAVPAGAQVLGGVEREAHRVSPRPHRPVSPRGAHRLGGVGDHREPARPRDRLDGRHVGELAVQVHGHHRARARVDGAGHRGGIDVVSDGIDVHEHRGGAGERDGAARGHEGERRGDDLVAGPDLQRSKREEQGVGAGIEAHPIPRPGGRRQLLLQRPAFRPHDEARRGEHALGRLPQLGAKRRVLALEIDLRNSNLGHGSSGCPSRISCPSVPPRAS